jgi:hypothetical protein
VAGGGWRRLSLAGALGLQAMAAYGQRATGAKVLINPNQDLPA